MKWTYAKLFIGIILTMLFAFQTCLAVKRLNESRKLPQWNYDYLLVQPSKNPSVCTFGWSDEGFHEVPTCYEVVSDGDNWEQLKKHCWDSPNLNPEWRHVNPCVDGDKTLLFPKSMVRVQPKE